MLRLRRIEIENFASFDEIVIEPSTDPELPLTVLRAENGSGKTTFLRALRWGMYGEQGLPGEQSRFSLHPAHWQPDDSGIRTQVRIEFETDGSTRHETQGTDDTTAYQLMRSVTTIGKPAARSDEPDFRRINEQTRLMVRVGDGAWEPHDANVDAVVEELLPWGLRDFFVMDADEAADFVGGSENKAMSRKEVVDKTTAAVHNLLGIDVFMEAYKRVEKLAREFEKQATRAIGDSDLNAVQAELDQLREEQAELAEKISGQQEQKNDLDDRLRKRKDDLETELKSVGAAEELRTRLRDNRRRTERALNQRKNALAVLAGEIESIDLMAALARDEITSAFAVLKPLYERGHIPLKHLNYVRDLLESGTCVCGQILSGEGSHRARVEALLKESTEQEKRADYLGNLHDAAKSLAAHAEATSWDDRCAQHAGDFADVEKELSDLKLEKRGIDLKLESLDEEKIQVIRDEIGALEEQILNLDRNLVTHQATLEPLPGKIDSLQKQIHSRQRNERAAADKRAAETMAELVFKVLKNAYATIRDEQVLELSQRMNRLFSQMAANVSDDDFEEFQRNKATLKMIAEVGLRHTGQDKEKYEIYAFNRRGRTMPPTEINGASRRVLALSFVLALCIESRTQAPLIADSLLNFMSGAVRRNTLKATAQNSSQPILLLTGADLEARSEVETVAQYAGATYTLTGQWDAIDAGHGGDVVHWTEQRPVSLVCGCGPRQYCKVCERVGQAGSPGWNKRG
ncbi:MAG: AAA family ATPase [Acidimicrobiaceae bacterium]|nr:AAA family ATPase [Acidimicrobiia bacterium]MCY4493671.1 AAA family ATPase [Acidimicrobiaceae bacterium]